MGSVIPLTTTAVPFYYKLIHLHCCGYRYRLKSHMPKQHSMQSSTGKSEPRSDAAAASKALVKHRPTCVGDFIRQHGCNVTSRAEKLLKCELSHTVDQFVYKKEPLRFVTRRGSSTGELRRVITIQSASSSYCAQASPIP